MDTHAEAKLDRSPGRARAHVRLVLLGALIAAACTSKQITATVAPQVSASAPLSPEAQELKLRLAWLEAQLEQGRIDTHVPGMAIAIVRGDEVIYAKGFGVSDLERQTPVTANTRFAIGSSTKAFSSTLAGMLMDEGKLDWDDPVQKYLPDFALVADDIREDQAVTLRDLFSHRSGFARMSMLWAGAKISRERMLTLASKAAPVAEFRNEFHYNNVTYMAGAVAAAQAAGTTWESLLQTRLLEPLGMIDTNASYEAARRDPEMATGYTWRKDMGRFEIAELRNIDMIGPAGSINSSVVDMARWLRMQLAYGEFEGKRLVSKNAILDTRRSVIQVAPGVDYGLGWMLRQWHEMKVVEHGGNIDGFSASVAMLPEEKLGVVLLTNASMTGLQQTAFTTVWEALLTDAYTREPNPSGEDFSRFVGKYVPELPGFEGEHFEVRIAGGKLAVDVPGQMLFTLTPPDENGWREFEATDEVAVSFPEGNSGPIDALFLHQSGMSFEMTREGVSRPIEVKAADVVDLLGHYSSAKGVSGQVLVRGGRLVFDIDKQMAFDLGARESDGEYHFRANYETFVVFDRGRGKAADKVVGLTLFEKGDAVKFERGPVPFGVAIDEVHARRKSNARHNAIAAGGIVLLEQHVEVLSAGIVGTSRAWFDAEGALSQEVRYGEGGELGSVKVVLGRGGGWTESSFDPKKHRELDGILLLQTRLAHPAVTLGDWRSVYSDESVARTYVDDAGAQIWVLRVRTPEFPATTLHVDATTGDVVKVLGFEISGSGVRVPVTTKFSDYRVVEGMRIPFRIEASNDQTGSVVMTTTAVKTGAVVERERFSPPVVH